MIGQSESLHTIFFKFFGNVPPDETFFSCWCFLFPFSVVVPLAHICKELELHNSSRENNSLVAVVSILLFLSFIQGLFEFFIYYVGARGIVRGYLFNTIRFFDEQGKWKNIRLKEEVGRTIGAAFQVVGKRKRMQIKADANGTQEIRFPRKKNSSFSH